MWLPIPLNTPKIKPCNVWKASDDIQAPKVWLCDVRVTPYHFAAENQTKWNANGYRPHHALQTSSVITQRSNLFRWPHILQKSDLHKAIRSRTHPPKVRLYDLRVTSDDLVSSENQRRDGWHRYFWVSICVRHRWIYPFWVVSMQKQISFMTATVKNEPFRQRFISVFWCFCETHTLFICLSI